jgi:hypothetical protein
MGECLYVSISFSRPRWAHENSVLTLGVFWTYSLDKKCSHAISMGLYRYCKSVLLVLYTYRQRDWNGPGSWKYKILFCITNLVPIGLFPNIANLIITVSGSNTHNLMLTFCGLSGIVEWFIINSRVLINTTIAKCLYFFRNGCFITFFDFCYTRENSYELRSPEFCEFSTSFVIRKFLRKRYTSKNI